MKQLFVFLFSLLFQVSFGQVPHFDLLTKDDGLPSNQVYDINEDKDGRIYIATNEGFVVYVSGKFIPIPTKTGEMPSGTGLKITDDNRVFCMSFDGRIFEIIEGKLQLFFDISKKLKSYPEFYLHSNFLVLINENEIHVYNLKNKTWKKFSANTEHIYIPRFRNNEIVFYDGPTLSSIHLFTGEKSKISGNSNSVFTFHGNDSVYVESGYVNGQIQVRLTQNQVTKTNKRLSQTLSWNTISDFTAYKNYFLLAGKYGLFQLDKKFNVLSYTFADEEIGNIFIDKNQQIWLTSPNKGLYIARNPSFTLDVKKNKREIMNIGGNNNQLFIENKGSLFKYDKNHIIQRAKNPNNIFYLLFREDIFATDKTQHLKSFEGKQLRRDIPNVKDIAFLDSNYLIIATRTNSIICPIHKLDSTILNRYFFQSLIYEDGIKIAPKRGLSVLYQKENKSIWLGNIDELTRFNPNKTIDTIQFNNSSIVALNLLQTNANETWASSKDGVYIIRNNKAFKKILENKKIFKLLKNNDYVYAVSSSEIFVVHTKTHSIVSRLSKNDGLPSSEIKNASIYRDSLFVLTPNGLVQGKASDLLARKITSPKLFLSSALIDDSITANFESIDFGFSTIQLNFEVIAPTSEDDFTIFYRLSQEQSFRELEKGNSTIQLNQLSEGKYNLEAKVIDIYGTESKTVSIPIQINPPFYRSNWFYLLIVLAVIGIISVIFIIRLNIVRKRLTLEKKLKASEITAIKSQMNPHFIFNALNSVQELILRKDVRNSNIYLGKFSELVRKVLSYSEKPEISLDDEISLLNLYLELEKLRFKDDFHYEITSNISVNSKFNLPSLLLQPYVENAVKHGLLHKEGEKKLNISFLENEQFHICVIEDNGIGRRKSAQIQERRAKYNQSFSTSANEKRIKLINEVSDKKIKLKIVDLENDKGTKVIFQFEK